jgi:hypothetical protein
MSGLRDNGAIRPGVCDQTDGKPGADSDAGADSDTDSDGQGEQ